MSMDYMEQRLFDLYDKYLYSYDELREKALAETCYTEYSKGGETFHRGYYCPSLVQDLIIGNANRGRLLKRRPVVNYDYIYYLNEARQIIMVDDFDSRKTLTTREFVIYQESNEVSVEYRMSCHSNQINMERASLCDYEAGKLRAYRHLCASAYCRDDGSRYVSKYSYSISAEDYDYDESGLLCESVLGEKLSYKIETSSGELKTEGGTYENAYRFFHNEDGFLYAYKPLEPRPDGLDPMYYVSKSKLRKI